MAKYLSPEWQQFIDTELAKEYMIKLKETIKKRRLEVNVYPPGPLTFNAFTQCPYNNLKVIIIGRDPYPVSGMADGMAYSVGQGATPMGLKNIFTEIFNDCFNGNTGGVSVSQHNDLTQWAEQGVLLLNSILTVEEGKPKSHAGLGWEEFTKNTVMMLDHYPRRLVFMLWGKDAKEYLPLIDMQKHLVLTSDHPASAGYKEGSWFGNKHFSQANNFLKKHYFNHVAPINWGVFNNPLKY